ncbi:hypothetical protein ACJX0J_037569, partial [Zea mays]
MRWCLRPGNLCLQNWNEKKIGDVRIQLEMARYLLHHLELAQDIRVLSPAEMLIPPYFMPKQDLEREKKIISAVIDGEGCLLTAHEDKLGDGSNTLVWKDRWALFQGAVDMTDRKFLRLACLFNIWGNQHNSMRWIRIADHLNLMQSNKKIKAPD